MTLEEARSLFPVLESVAYLNAGTFGPLARPVAEALELGVERDLAGGRTGRRYFEETLALRDDLRAAFVALVGTGPESVALTTSTNTVLQAVLAVDNTDAGSTWVPLNIAFAQPYAGQTVRLRFSTSNDSSGATSFYFDSLALTATYCE